MRHALLHTILLLLPVHASAETTAEAMQAFGLLGTWAGECALPASPANNHAIYSITPAGAVQLTNILGEDQETRFYTIVDARPTVRGNFSMRQVSVKDETIVLDVVLLKEDGKVRVWSSHTGDGRLLVKEGMIGPPVNRETRWV